MYSFGCEVEFLALFVEESCYHEARSMNIVQNENAMCYFGAGQAVCRCVRDVLDVTRTLAEWISVVAGITLQSWRVREYSGWVWSEALRRDNQRRGGR